MKDENLNVIKSATTGCYNFDLTHIGFLKSWRSAWKGGEEVEDIDSETYDSFHCGENLDGELIKRIWSLK